MSLRNKSFVFPCLMLLASCANIVAPQGGPKDEVAPYATNAYPMDSSLNFTASKISISFSENIQLKDAQKNITISPALKGNSFIIESEKNKLLIKLKNLSPNTTYTINAATSIADITEGNTLPNLKYVFSTGSTIDSLALRGKVINAITLQACPNSLVCLYENFTDSSIIKLDPEYFVYTNELGDFYFENIKDAAYHLVAVEDKNNNKRWEVGEELGFITSDIRLDSTKKNMVVRRFGQVGSINYLISAESPSLGVYSFVFNGLNNNMPKINQEDPSMDKRERYYDFIYKPNCADINYTKYVISNLNPKDSAHFNYTVNSTLYKKSIAVSRGTIVFKPIQNSFIFIKDSLGTIPFLRTIDTTTTIHDKIRLFRDTVLVTDYTIQFDAFFGITIGNLLEGTYNLVVKRGAFSDILGVENDSFELIITVLPKENLQELTLRLDSTFSGNYSLLISSENLLCKTENIKQGVPYKISHLIAGKYKITIINTSDVTVGFTNGDIFKKIQPTFVYYYKEFDIKSGIDIDETITVMYK